MHARMLLCTAALLLASIAGFEVEAAADAGAGAVAADDADDADAAAMDTRVRAALTDSGDTARLTVVSGGKKPGVTLRVGGGKPISLYSGEAAATIEAGHGRVLIAVAIDSEKQPFQILVFEDGKLGEPRALARPNQRTDYPYAVVATPTRDGFTVFFQEVEPSNPDEAHTYMVELDKTGAVTVKPREIQVPWALAAAAWNGNGYHLGLYYTGGGDGIRLSMVSLTKAGVPEQHPDWASAPGLVSDVHLVAAGKAIRAYYRGGMGDRMYETDVTKIGQWGRVMTKAKDRGALAANHVIAITAKGQAMRINVK